MNKYLFLSLFIFPMIPAAQNLGLWEIGGSVLMTSYEGDLHAPDINYTLKNIQPAVSGYIRREVGRNATLRLNLMVGKIAGADKSFEKPAWRQIRGASFESTIVEGSVLAEIYPLSFFSLNNSPSNAEDMPRGSQRGGTRLFPYALIGFGAAFSNPTVAWNDANGNPQIDPSLAQMDKNAKTKRTHFVLPFGAGLRYKLTDHFTIHLEGLLRPTFSDYLDGFSQAGNPNKNDWFFTAGIGVGYTLPGKNGMYSYPTVN